jgi:hypothetical protein
MRDPFVLVDREESRYYLFGTTDPDPWHGEGVGFDAYHGTDLQTWHGPHEAFRPPPGFWGKRNFWAPEVYRHAGHYVLFASFSAGVGNRALQALRSPRPLGPYLPHGEPLTPPDWQCLDGTLLLEEGVPWLVFCHEWLQVNDGEVCRQQLTDDLSSPVGEPELLFRASAAPWVRPVQERYHFVTDGPFLHRTQDGTLLLLWSSFARGGYAVGVATSSSGRLAGPWKHQRRPLTQGISRGSDGGHAMVFRDLEEQLVLTLHSPNQSPLERPIFLPLLERGGRLLVTPPSRLGSSPLARTLAAHFPRWLSRGIGPGPPWPA